MIRRIITLLISIAKLTALYIFIALPLLIYNGTILLMLVCTSNLIKAIKPTTHKQNKKGEQ